MNSPQNFLHEAAKTFAFCPGQMRQAVASMPCGEGSQTGEVKYQREQRSRFPQTSTPRLPKLNG